MISWSSMMFRFSLHKREIWSMCTFISLAASAFCISEERRLSSQFLQSFSKSCNWLITSSISTWNKEIETACSFWAMLVKVSSTIIERSFMLITSVQCFSSVADLIFSKLYTFIFLLHFILLEFLFHFNRQISILESYVFTSFIFISLLISYFLLFARYLFYKSIALYSI